MSLDSASDHVSFPTQRPSYTPTHTVQTIGSRWAVAAGHPLAAEAGARMLNGGGPAVSTPEYFHSRHGGQIPPGLGRTVVPAAPDAWLTALERWGTMSFADAVGPALEHAERG